jgi:hypothetical protein
MAHAADTPAQAIPALQRVIELKPDYAPARDLLFKKQLEQAESLIKADRTTEVLEFLRRLTREYPNNVDILWLLVRASPGSAEQIAYCEQILAIQPDHELAKRRLEVKRQSKHVIKAGKEIRRPVKRSRPWAIMGLLGLLVMIGTGVLIATLVMGRNLNPFRPGSIGTTAIPVKHNVGTVTGQGVSQRDTIAVGEVHEYEFNALADSTLLAMVIFPTVDKNIDPAIKLIDPDGLKMYLYTGSDKSTKMAIMQADLTKSGHYVLQITGMEGISQGFYSVQIAVQPK